MCRGNPKTKSSESKQNLSPKSLLSFIVPFCLTEVDRLYCVMNAVNDKKFTQPKVYKPAYIRKSVMVDFMCQLGWTKG